MSVIKTTTNWNGMIVEEYTNTITGEIELKTTDGSILARSDSNEWEYIDEKTFRRIYNDVQINQGNSALTEAQFDITFITEGQKIFNTNRADILNNNSSNVNKSAFFENNIPFITDPVTKITVNADGTKPNTLTTTEQIEPEDQNQTSLEYTDNRETSDSSRLLKYPLLEPPAEFQYDYIMIQAFDYVASGLSNSTDPLKNLGPAREITILPMQPNISETNVVNWSDDQLNPVKAALADFASGTISAGLNFSADDFKSAVSRVSSFTKETLDSPNLKPFVAAYFAGQAVGSNILGRSTGMVVNPNLELLFNGPNLRTFNFSFRFTPRNKDEAEMIRLIIRAFKRNSAVIREPGFLFLRSPRVFKLQYIYKGSSVSVGGSDLHPYLNKIKPCALTSFSVNYTPDNSYMTFENGSLTCYQVDMTFSELMPIYEDELQGFEPNMGY